MEGYSEHDRARWVGEPSGARSPFARDRARVLHSAGLRRLAATTQVLVAGTLDFPRTRLTHTLEVAQIGRELGGALGCDADVVDVAGLAHDIGHPPFGHNGEAALDAAAHAIGGFEGNAQTLRVLTRLEAKAFGEVDGGYRSVGLNLTRAGLDAASKYPWPRREGQRKFGAYDDDLAVFAWLREGAPGDARCMEAQVMDWSDDVAYSVHDLEDAVVGGHVLLGALRDPQEQQAIATAAAEFRGIEAGEALEALRRLVGLAEFPREFDGSLPSLAALKALTSSLISRFCAAAEQATRAAHGPGRLTRYAASLEVPQGTRAEVAALKAVTVRHVMRRAGAEDLYVEQREQVAGLVTALMLAGPEALEPAFRHAMEQAGDDAQRLRAVIDQVASLTDISAVQWHRRLCG